MFTKSSQSLLLHTATDTIGAVVTVLVLLELGQCEEI